MTLPVVFRRRAQSDLAGTFDWYEEQRSGLGEELLSAVQSTSKALGATSKCSRLCAEQFGAP